jgi:hypothetical protein
MKNMDVASTEQKTRKWYNNYTFPLVPELKIREANEHNTKSFSFHWLFFKFWSLDSFQFEIAFNIDDHWGVGFSGLLPYLRWVIAIPCPPRLQSWICKNLWRHSK